MSQSSSTHGQANGSSGATAAKASTTPGEVDGIVARCHAALDEWSNWPVQNRCDVLLRAADLLEDPSEPWAAALRDTNREETPINDWWSQEQVDIMPDALRTLAVSAAKALQEESVQVEHGKYFVSREPYGVCLAIAAWNAVHPLTMRAICTPLIAGNTVILKTSEITPRTQALWADLLYESGLPREALHVVHANPEHAPAVVEAIVADPRVRHVNFTGSTRVGSIIASLAGKHLKPSVMELGGKAPVLILPDADIAAAASHVLFGAFHNAGQICMSTERVIVPYDIADKLVSAIQSAWARTKPKSAPRVFSPGAAERIAGLVEDAHTHGARNVLSAEDSAPLNGAGPHEVTARSNGHDGAASLYSHETSRTILHPVTPEMRLYREESFGPTAAIIVVPETIDSSSQNQGEREAAVIDEMIRIANDSEYGLSAAVWGRDTDRALAVARRLNAGGIHINQPTPADDPRVPHGGWKSSGWGRFNGVEGIRAFTQTKSIEVPDGPSQPLPLDVFHL